MQDWNLLLFSEFRNTAVIINKFYNSAPNPYFGSIINNRNGTQPD